ncbi:MAG: hypothetical protein LUD72_08330 [Bacteroidales bacterium]|nr:hypothetical protein [Bacteroidales bacterium]
MKTPQEILDAIKKGETPINNDCFPYDGFAEKLVDKYFQNLTEGKENIDVAKTAETMSRLITACQKIEARHKEELEKLACDKIVEMIKLPQDANTLEIEGLLVSGVDTKSVQQIPEDEDEISFDSLDDMDKLTGEVEKRRMLNVMICGAAEYFTSKIGDVAQDLFRIDPELPAAYLHILDINRILLYLGDEQDNTTEAGKVDVYLSSGDVATKVKAEAILWPILVQEGLKGVFELAISHGLPEERDKADYVLRKCDAMMFNLWDLRMGMPLWERIMKCVNASDSTLDVSRVAYFLMLLSEMEYSDFKTFMKETLAITEKGKTLMAETIDTIEGNINQCEFDSYIRQEENGIDDDGYFDADELMGEDW